MSRIAWRGMTASSHAIRRVGVAAMTIALVLASAPATVADSGAPAPAALSRCAPHLALRQSLHTFLTRNAVPGAAVLVTDPGPAHGVSCRRWSEAVGAADLRTGRPMNATDRLRAGSVAKTFTATVVLQLAAERRLSLDAPMDRYLPGLIRAHG